MGQIRKWEYRRKSESNMSDRSEGIRVLLLNLQNQGSAPALTRTLIDELKAAGRLAGVIVDERNELLERIVSEAAPAPVEILKLSEWRGGLPSIVQIASVVARVSRMARASAARDVVIPNIHPCTAYAVPLLRVLGIKAYSGIHDFEPHEGDPLGFYRRLNFIACLGSHRVLFFSKIQHGLACDRWPWFAKRYISLRLPTEYRRERTADGITRRFDFLFFGRIEAYKGMERLLEAFAKVRATRPSVTLHISGSQGYRCTALEEAEDPHITKSIRYVPDRELPEILLGARVVVLPYSSATQSGVAYIGAVYGCNVVCTPCGGLVEQAGYNPRMKVSADFTADALAEAMIESLDGWTPETGRSTLVISSGLLDIL
jgi:glycosyltransferase involved in cell wall biosynthesis